MPNCLLEWLNYQTFPRAMPKGPSFYASLSALDTVIIFYFNCSDRCVIISHCGFNWHFPMVNNADIFFMSSFATYISSLENLFPPMSHFCTFVRNQLDVWGGFLSGFFTIFQSKSVDQLIPAFNTLDIK